MMKKYLLVLMNRLILIMMALLIAACSTYQKRWQWQICKENYRENTPTSDFIFHHNGTVTDTTTHLNWKRCPEGYTFSDHDSPDFKPDDSCEKTGKTTYTWPDAMQLDGDGYAGRTGWRLPSIDELQSIVEKKCSNPAVNLTIFPVWPTIITFKTWSSSPIQSPDHATYLDFHAGLVGIDTKVYTYHARLVRNTRPIEE